MQLKNVPVRQLVTGELYSLELQSSGCLPGPPTTVEGTYSEKEETT
jgi:hypothetical protein